MVASHAADDRTVYSLVRSGKPLKLSEPGHLEISVCEPWVDRPRVGGQSCLQVLDDSRGHVTLDAFTGGALGPRTTTTVNSESMRTEFFQISMAQLADHLTSLLNLSSPGQPSAPALVVIDKTGLNGEWHLVLDRFYEQPVSPLPELSSALDKIGLKLERSSAIGPREILKVDSIDKNPTEN
jgi:uncharacterized protein (TIGR03435 family)